MQLPKTALASERLARRKNANPLILYLTAFIVFGALAINLSLLGAASAILIVALVWLSSKESRTINPYVLFLSTPISLMMYSESVSAVFLPAMDQNVQLLIIGGIYAYLAGLLTVRVGRQVSQPENAPRYSFVIILALGLVPHFLGVVTTGFPALAADVKAAREAYILPIIGQFVIFLPVSILIAFQRRSKFLIFVSVMINVFFTVMMAAKFPVMLAGLFFLYAYFRYDGRRLFKVHPVYLAIFSIVAVPLLFDAVFSLREDLDQSEYFWRQAVFFDSKFLNNYGDYTYLPYLYSTTPWSNFSYIVEEHTELSYGVRSSASLVSVLQLDGLFDLDERPIRMVQFNTHAFLSDFYMDFGILGVVFLSYLLGMLVKWSYTNSLKRPDVLSEGAWIAVGFASLLLFFSNHFTGLTYPLLALLLFNAYRFLSRTLKRKPRLRLTRPSPGSRSR